MTTLQQTINYALPYIQYSPLAVGTGNEPAISISNEIQALITNPPFTWPWNRTTFNFPLTSGISDYIITLTNFSFIERATLIAPDGTTTFEAMDVYNNFSVGSPTTINNKRGRPNSICVLETNAVTYGSTGIRFRFMGCPDQNYSVELIYQNVLPQIANLTDTWGIPYQYLDIYNNLFIGESMAIVDDARANYYRQRGVAALLSKAEGLTALQKDAFLQQYWQRDTQQAASQLKNQQSIQARGI